MTSFSIFESFLFFSLATTFVLILLLFYHFKSRLSSIEKKCDTLFEISQNLAAQITNNASNIIPSIPPSKMVDVDIDNEFLKVKKFEEFDSENVEQESEDEYEEVEVTDDEAEEQEQEEEEDEEESDEEQIEEIKEIEEIDTIEKIDVPTISNEEVYKKMSVGELKQLVITKGLSTQPSKLKKAELLDLLKNN